MKEQKRVKIAMAGTGFAANIHAEAYENLPGIDAENRPTVGFGQKESDLRLADRGGPGQIPDQRVHPLTRFGQAVGQGRSGRPE